MLRSNEMIVGGDGSLAQEAFGGSTGALSLNNERPDSPIRTPPVKSRGIVRGDVRRGWFKGQ